MAKIFGVILAGGAGSRLGGANKAELRVGGAALLDRAKAALAPAEQLAVAGGARLTAGRTGGLPLLPDPVAGAGPLAGLAAGLAWAEAGGADWLLSTPVDAPFLAPSAFERLLRAADDKTDAVIAEADGRMQWLVAAWRPGLATAARTALAECDLAVARFAQGLRWRALPLPEAGPMFFNVNAPADLAIANARANTGGRRQMPDAETTKLLETVVARLCHDLIGPVGAVHNGVELAEESESADEAKEMIGMVKESAAQAWGRLAFFRAAFGSGGGLDGFGGVDIKQLLTGGLATRRLSFEVSGSLATADYKLSLAHARIAFGLAMAAGESLPRGGVVTVIAGGAVDAPQLAAIGEGERGELRDEIEAALAGAPPDPRSAHVCLLLARAKALGLTVEADAGDGRTSWKTA